MRIRRWAGAAALLVAALLTSGCGIANGITSERNSTDPLRQSYGFPSAKVTYTPIRPASASAPMTVVVVATPQTLASTSSNVAPIDQQYLEIASDVWSHFAYSFTTLSVTIKGSGTRTYSYSDMLHYFGGRPHGFGKLSIGYEAYSAWSYIYDGGYALGSLIVVLIVLKIVRRQKRKVAKIPVSEGKYGGWHHQMTHFTPHHHQPKTWSAPATEPVGATPAASRPSQPPPPGPPPVPVPAGSWSPPPQTGTMPPPATRPASPRPAQPTTAEEPAAGFARRPFARPGPPADAKMPTLPKLPSSRPPEKPPA